MSWDWLNRKGYADMMRALSTHKLKQTEAIAYLALVSFVDSNGYAYPGIDTIAKTAGITRRSVLRALPVLEKHGLVQIKRGQGRTVNHYRVIPPQSCSDNLSPQDNPLWCQSDRLWCQSVTCSGDKLSPQRLPANVPITPLDGGDDDYIPFDQIPEDL